MFKTVSHLSWVLLNIKHYNFKPLFQFPNLGLKYHLPRPQIPVCGGGRGKRSEGGLEANLLLGQFTMLKD